MPVLSNPRHERFAQGLAEGKTATEAYIEAGYKEQAAAQAASRLLTDVKISARVDEILEKSAEKVKVDLDYVFALLKQDRAKAYATNQTGAAVAASTAIGKLYGLFVDRTEAYTVVRDISAVPLTDEEWEAQSPTVQ